MDKQKSPLSAVEVILAKPHEHDGVKYSAGDRITVTAPEHEWLRAQQIITAPAPAKETK